MKLLELKFNNFLSFDTLHLTEECLGSGLINISGGNGAGKSAIFEAIFWALYGKSTRPVVKWGKKETDVYLRFSIKGVEYEITRTSGNGSSLHFFRLTPEKTKLHEHKMPDTQALILATIGLHQDSFKHLYYLCDGLTSKFSSLNDVNRKYILDQLLETPKALEDALAKVKKDLNSNNMDIKTFDNQTFEANSECRVLSSSIAEIEIYIKDTSSKVTTLLRVADVQLTKYQTELNETQEKILILKKVISTLTPTITTFIEFLNPLKLYVKQLNSKLAVNRSERESQKQLIAQKICPTCNQSYPDKQLEDAENEILSLSGLIHNDSTKLLNTETEITNTEIELQKATTLKSSTESELKHLHDSIPKLNASIKSLDTTALDTLRTSVYERKMALKDKQCRLNECNEANLYRLSESEKLTELNKKLKVLESIFSPQGIKALLLQEAVENLDLLTKEYLNILSNNTMNIEILSDTTLGSGEKRDKIDILVNSFKIERFSSGQRRRIDFAIQLALSEVVAQLVDEDIGFLILDEVLDTLDPIGLEYIVDLLTSLSENKLIFLTSHNPSITELLNNRIEVRKWQVSIHEDNSTLSI